MDDYTKANLSRADRVLLDHVAKLTREPWAMTESDIHALREVGFSDGAIHDLTFVAGYYAFVNRLADGLGVEIEAGRDVEDSGP